MVPGFGLTENFSAQKAAWACARYNPVEAAKDAAVAAQGGSTRGDAWVREREWQWERAQQYARNEVSLVGARTFKSIKANPQATSLDVYNLSMHDRLAALNHPNCPLALWITLAIQYPAEALASPAGQIFLLEDPMIWERIEKDHIGQWISDGARRLSAKDNRLLAADIAEHVLPLPKEWSEEETAARHLIAVARAAAHEKVTPAELEKAHAALVPHIQFAARQRKGDLITRALNAAQSTADPSPPHAVIWACHHASYVAADLAAERRWQWQRQQEYLRGEVQTVGARFRTNKQLMADPMAAEDDLYLLAKKKPLLALAHPNCPAELWWELAENHPLEAEASILYPILTLEAPERWAELEKRCIWSWTYTLMSKLPIKMQHLFAAECANRVLHIWEDDFPRDKRPRQAIAAARAFGNGKATQSQLDAAYQAALRSEMDMSDGGYDNACAANTAAFAASPTPVKVLQVEAPVENETEEERWRLRRVREYIAKLQKKDA